MKKIAFTDSVTTCECCGRTELKGTYLVIDESNEYYYGSTCVKRNLNISQSELTNQVKEYLNERIKMARDDFYNSNTYYHYKNVLDFDYQYGDAYYNNNVKPASNSVAVLKKEICKKYNLLRF